MPYQLVAPSPEHIKLLMTWFPDQDSLFQWGGPVFSFPFSADSFKRDLNLANLSSFALTDESDSLLGFGQYYQRLDKCHLARIAVSPVMRGKGIGQVLLQRLINSGLTQLSLTSASLFVLADNKKAIKAYESFGFIETQYPESIGLPNCLYMTKTNAL